MQERPPSYPSDRPTPEPNPFGHVDHSAFGGFGADLVYGLTAGGWYVHISAVPSGLACQCVCPACKRVIVARKGRKTRHHFAHHGAGTGCGRGAETNAHIWAKEVLAREKRILLPAVAGREGRERLQTHSSQFFEFADAKLEHVLGDIVPDVMLITKGGRRLLVEVMVTHECGPDKIAKLRAAGLPTVEVDLAAYRTSTDQPAIERALIEGARRTWLFNEKADAATHRLQKQIADREEARRQRERRAAEAVRQSIDRKVAHLITADRSCAIREVSAGADDYAELRKRGLSDMVVFALDGMGFLVPSNWWQAAIYCRVIDAPYSGKYNLPNFKVADVVDEIRDCIHPAFHMMPDDQVCAALRKAVPGAELPHDAVHAYLQSLWMTGVLEPDGGGGYEFSDDRAEAIEADYQRRRAAQRRRDKLDEALDTILAAVTPDELWRFDIDAWRGARPAPLRRPALLIVEEGGERWDQLYAGLAEIKAMIGGGPIVAQTWGLPLAGLVNRCATARQAKAVEHAARRRVTLITEAQMLLGDEARDWLHGAGDASAPITRAEASPEALAQAMEEVALAGRQRGGRKRAEAKKVEVQEVLRAAAISGLGAETGELFLRHYDPVLQARPGDHCVDENSLYACTKALERWRARGTTGRRGAR